MTREHKLALIIGFSLVLVVGVLISDHFSKARSQPLASEMTPGNAERFGADTRGMRVVSVSAPGPTILTPPAGASTPVGLLPPSSDPTVAPPASDSVIVMGTEPMSNESLLTKAIGAGNSTPLANTGQTMLPPVEPSPSGVRQLDPATGTLINTPVPPAPQGGSPNLTPGGNPGAVPPITAPRTDPAKVDLVNGVPLNMMKRHDVREGESAYRIAQEAYGDGKLWTKLAEYNKGKMTAGGSLREGVTLLLPPKEALLGKPLPTPEATVAPGPVRGGLKLPPPKVDPGAEVKTAAKTDKPEPKADKAAPKTYTIQKGDSLSDIARKTLGSSRRWSEIVEMNNLDDEDTLVVGKTLKIPAH